MSTDPINTGPIQQFIKQTQAADRSNAKEIRLDISTAKNLSYTLGIVMARLNGDLEKFVKENQRTSDEVIEVRLGGSGEWQ
jgi:hypothetical protein